MTYDRGVRVLALALAISMTACSWVVVQKPPAVDPGTRPVDCTESRGGPVLDTLAGIGFIAVAAAVKFDDSADDSARQTADANQRAMFVTLSALPFLIAARHGYEHTARCRAMNRPR